MGTRAIVYVKENNKKIIEMYSQHDGYPHGLGKELRDFLREGKLTNNGYTFGDLQEAKRVFNGTEDLAAQLVAYFKDGTGGIYLYPPTRNYRDKTKYYEIYGAEYVYEIKKIGNELQLKCWNCRNNKQEFKAII